MSLPHAPDAFCFFPFREGKSDPDWSTLLKFIKTSFPSNYNSAVQAACDRLVSSKKVIAESFSNKLEHVPNEGFIDQTLKPYIQLVAMAQAHLPLQGGAVKNLQFTWKDSLEDTKHVSANANLEIFSCVYNMAASYAYLASVDAQSGTVDGVKEAFKQYQGAAGIYQHLASTVIKRLPPQNLSGDATVESLELLTKMCLAQAHHCSYLKAEIEMRGKHAMLSKLAEEGGKQYDNVAAVLRNAPLKEKLPYVSAMEMYCQVASAVMHARAQLHLAVERAAASEMGEAIARYNLAWESLTRSPSKVSPDSLKAWMVSVRNFTQDGKSKAISENETIYFLRIPKEVPMIEGIGRGMGKATPCSSFTSFKSTRETDPFFGIVPAHIVHIVGTWRTSMQQQASNLSKAVTARRERTRAQLSALGVVGAIAAITGEGKTRGRLPDALRAKITALRTDPDGKVFCLMEQLTSMVEHCRELRTSSHSRIADIAAELDREAQDDDANRAQFGEIWLKFRRPSREAPDSLACRRMIIDHTSSVEERIHRPIENAVAAINQNLRELSRLDWPLDELDALKPYALGKAAKEKTAVELDAAEKLSSILRSLDQVEEQESARLKELNALLDSDDVVQELSGVEADKFEPILDAASNQIKDKMQSVQDEMNRADGYLSTAETIMTAVASMRSEDPIAIEIEKIANSLEAATNIYRSVVQDLSEVSTVALSLAELIEASVGVAKSFCLGRTLEAADLSSTIQREIASKMVEIEKKKVDDQSIQESQRRQQELARQIEEMERERETARTKRANEMLQDQQKAQYITIQQLSLQQQQQYQQQGFSQQTPQQQGQQLQQPTPPAGPQYAQIPLYAQPVPPQYYQPVAQPQQQQVYYFPQAQVQPPNGQTFAQPLQGTPVFAQFPGQPLPPGAQPPQYSFPQGPS